MKLLKSLKEKNIREFIIILYIVGIIGSALPFTRDFFILLTPFVLLLSFVILLAFHSSGFNAKLISVLILIFILSFAVEVAGVKTGIIFGRYFYGSGLGLKILDTPLIIGLNWVLLVYCTAAIFEKASTGRIIRISGASLLMLAYDFIMEQVAPVMDMWSFEGGTAPVRNYISWFILSILFHSLISITGVRIVNRFGPLVFFCQLIFFIVLLLLFKIIL